MLKILLVVLLIAVAIYGLVRLLERGAAKRKPPTPLAPDDDLDFLRDLDWQQRKDRQRRAKESGDSSSEPTDPDEGSEDPTDPDEPQGS